VTDSVDKVPGPYWINTATNGEHKICGRHGKVIRTYRADQLSLADADCKQLQIGFVMADKRLRDAAGDLLASLQGYMSAVATMNAAMGDGVNVHGAIAGLLGWEDMAKAAIARATGGAS